MKGRPIWMNMPTLPQKGASVCSIPSVKKWALIPSDISLLTVCWKPSALTGKKSAPIVGTEKNKIKKQAVRLPENYKTGHPPADTVNGLPFYRHNLILHIYLLFLEQWIRNQPVTRQIFPVHIHSRNLTIFIGCIIIDSSVRIAAGAVDRHFILPFFILHAAPLLLHSAQNMEKLADTLHLRISGNRIHFCKCSFHKSGRRG